MIKDLRTIPFLSDLEDMVLERLVQRLQHVHYQRGSIVFSEDETGDCMYLIESGQVRLAAGKNGQEKPVALLGPGNFFGETALLLDQKRGMSAQVVLDADLLVLRKDVLDELMQEHPAVAVTITRELTRRLGVATQTLAARDEFKIIVAAGPTAPRLARFLAAATGEDVLLYDVGGLPNVTLDPADLAQAGVFIGRSRAPLGADALASQLSALVGQYYWAVLSIAPYETPSTLKALELADWTIALGRAARNWLKTVSSKELWYSDENDKSLQKLVRRITRRQVGLALSSGNARGFAHIGVFEVLEREGIPIDMMAGTSAGAVFGGLYAAGRSLAEIRAFAVEVQRLYRFTTGFRYWDFSIPPRTGLIKGNMVLAHFRRWLRNKNFDDLLIPLYIIATDLISGEEIVFERGPVAEAIRASMSVMGILEPAHVGDRYLIDGGSVNPVPSQLLVDKGMDIVIASNVIPSLEDRIHRRELKREGRLPNAAGILIGAMEIMESEIIKTRMGRVDVLIEPDVARYGTTEYDKVHELIRRGQEAAAGQMDGIRQLLAPRPRPPLRTAS